MYATHITQQARDRTEMSPILVATLPSGKKVLQSGDNLRMLMLPWAASILGGPVLCSLQRVLLQCSYVV
jgi:hypothetical protein